MSTTLSRMLEIVSSPVGTRSPQVFRRAFDGESLFSLREAQQLFQSDSLRDEAGSENVQPGHEQISLVRDMKAVPNAEQRTFRDAERLRRAGATVMFRWLHTMNAAVRVRCQDLADAGGLAVFANGFWTPAGKQGFPFHADADTVFAHQIQGEKTWLLFEPRRTDPTAKDFDWMESPEEGNLHSQFKDADYQITVQPNDILVVPRGWGHRALAEEGRDSVHVSIGFLHEEIDADRRAHQYPVRPSVA